MAVIPRRANTTANTTANTSGAAQPPAYKPKNYSGWTIQQANDWRNQVENEINRRKPLGQDISNWQSHYQDVNKYIQGLRGVPQQGPPLTTTPQATTPYAPPDTLNRPQAVIRYQEAANRLKGLQKGTPEYERNAQILQGIGNKFGFRWQDQLGADWKPTVAQPTPPPGDSTQPPADTTQPPTDGTATPETPAAEAPGFDWQNYQSPMTKALMEAYGQQMQGLATQNNFFGNSPAFTQSRDEGMKALERKLAAQGLTGSGAAIEGQNDFMSKLVALESDKQRQWATDLADRAQRGMEFISKYDQSERESLRDQMNTDKGREIDLAQFDATRNDAWRNTQLGTLMQILGLQAQSSPMNDIYKAIGDQGGIYRDIANKIANVQANDYVRVSAPGGGGGGTGTPPPIAPADYTMPSILALLASRNNSGGNTSLVNTGIGALQGILGMFGGGGSSGGKNIIANVAGGK